MNREEAHKHKKRKSGKTLLFTGLFIAVCVSVLIAFLFALGGADFEGVFGNGNYWLTVGVVNGLLLIAFLLMYRIDAQNVALNENDLEDTEWLTTKSLKKLFIEKKIPSCGRDAVPVVEIGGFVAGVAGFGADVKYRPGPGDKVYIFTFREKKI